MSNRQLFATTPHHAACPRGVLGVLGVRMGEGGRDAYGFRDTRNNYCARPLAAPCLRSQYKVAAKETAEKPFFGHTFLLFLHTIPVRSWLFWTSTHSGNSNAHPRPRLKWCSGRVVPKRWHDLDCCSCDVSAVGTTLGLFVLHPHQAQEHRPPSTVASHRRSTSLQRYQAIR